MSPRSWRGAVALLASCATLAAAATLADELDRLVKRGLRPR